MKSSSECKCFEGIEKVLKTHLGHLKPVESINCCTECRPYNYCYDKECTCHECKEKCTSCYSTACECSCETCVYPINPKTCNLHPEANGKCVCFLLKPKEKIKHINGSFDGRMSCRNAHEDMLKDLYNKMKEVIDHLNSL